MDKFFEWVVFAIISLVVVLLVVSVYGSGTMWAQCKADGYKDYECYSILNGGAVIRK